jgi:hypothetical protein
MEHWWGSIQFRSGLNQSSVIFLAPRAFNNTLIHTHSLALTLGHLNWRDLAFTSPKHATVVAALNFSFYLFLSLSLSLSLSLMLAPLPQPGALSWPRRIADQAWWISQLPF